MQEEIIMFKIWIYGFSFFVLASTTTSNSSENVEVRLLDNQNAPLVATLDMSKADKRIKQFVSETVETQIKTIEETVNSKRFVNDAIEAKMKHIDETVQSMQLDSDTLVVKVRNIEETVKSKQFLRDALKAIKRDQEVNLKLQIANLERNLTAQLDDYIDDKVGKKVKENEKTEKSKQRPIDCGDVKTKTGNGIYKIYPKHSVVGFDVYCDFEIDNTGWTVFQRRLNGSIDFYRGWNSYVNGFGDLEAEFWLGNQKIHSLTKQGNYELRVDISDFHGTKAYARYASFSVGDASTNYKLTVTGYSGNAGDSLDYSNGQAFTTKDRDNFPVGKNCAIRRQGAWWYKHCAESNLNGVYREGIEWYHWKKNSHSMKSSSMMIRRL
ncbi:Ficolin-1-A,Ryncolin-1,Fibrinogen C domain-containing protein 1,Tenascin-N,Angiopoietin-related protein 7,Ficolin-3,Fibrinogen C domain-containing protein 1-B,Fibrinogen-like protein 1,Ficolin-1,Ficolin-1-B,Tenascin-R,Ryncolin-2,Techylectin-5B,Fibrinogen C domain-containing protein 1-A,Microfibril-associated glycoprotein 4,Fibrinogen-like protein A,Ryncolin-3,Tenascin-X,Ficolin-2,Tenascin,Angiopoietin-related protein 2,Techylectin-5A,Ryncolin-4 [Mytilus edulis]|uniref:Fibrinogen C-terminal domain-containing protein n=1 Tax=Mytilus edulis TaxID=6550 RepID=A0A8S3QIB6_MYTED|nr:Ficolin-1-A,Ryncolin-1,Fibrinogen C domain-containing protein 1,Tenascin-N,Angiopoietin-related protein 7,Ficolin-3,Fibrinogen C domain-containing protein 1-B,Fibrinogen-like protein 1,Ficolin-1,Ficolin-1-B,Tenascin-R,Ryncolin-2,Techylectin-5B,Fibrinogen C domain-containing protein 1-A,Microfibril-associated glycoprotein 4,Fibrinogen-like protein A,Ryncolin-3,Tenascin-X,Ficolin-2,Tenascin,Angiopoietin-related protein 2,Techylectin-5A,Ryncolin-4 [Mytilus edulis]